MYKQLFLKKEEMVKYFTVFENLAKEAIGEYNWNVFYYSKVGKRFFEAPASAKVQYHNCYPGGLVEHSLRVYGNLRYMATKFLPYHDEKELRIVSLFHDVGKVGTLDHPYFLLNENKWRAENLGEYYTINSDLLYMDSAQRSIFLLNTLGITLTEVEYQAILISDGQYIEANKRYAHKESMLALLLHQADMIACKQEHEKWKRFNYEKRV